MQTRVKVSACSYVLSLRAPGAAVALPDADCIVTLGSEVRNKVGSHRALLEADEVPVAQLPAGANFLPCPSRPHRRGEPQAGSLADEAIRTLTLENVKRPGSGGRFHLQFPLSQGPGPCHCTVAGHGRGPG
jgi:hypothetical protein